MKLYKYRSTSKYSLEGLINNELYFSSHEDFNDPFEFGNPAPNIQIYNKNARKKFRELYDKKEITRKEFLYLKSLVDKPSNQELIERKETLEKIKENTLAIGVHCLSEIDNNILMWSHYAEDHKGFCIGFNNLDKQIQEKPGVIKVKYLNDFEDLNNPELLVDFYMTMFRDNKNLPQLEWERKYKELAHKLSRHEESELARAVIGNKYIDWSYEREIRLILNQTGSIKYNPESIETITFGLRTSKSDKLTILNICNTEDKQHIRFREAVKSNSGYGLKIANLSQK